MDNRFDEELKEMAKRSKVKEPDKLRENVNITCKNLKYKKSNYKKFVMAASISIVALITLGIYSNTYADDDIFVKRVINYFIEKYDFINEGHKENSDREDILVESNGYSITIEDVYYDRVEMTIFYKINSKEPLDRSKEYFINSEIKSDVEIDIQWGDSQGEFVDDFTYIVVQQLYMMENNSGELPEVFSGTLNIYGLTVKLDNNYEGIPIETNSITLNLDSSKNRGEEVEINKMVSLDEVSTEYIKAKKLPTGITLDLIRDGNIFSKYIIEEYLWDSEKGPLRFKSRVYDDSSGSIILTRRFEKPSENGELMIVPYIYTAGPYGDGSDILRSSVLEENTKLDLGKFGSMEVGKIDYKEDKTIITIKTKGYISLELFNTSLIGDEDNNYYEPISINNREIYDLMEIKADFVFGPMDSNKKYFINYFETPRLEILEDEIIKIW